MSTVNYQLSNIMNYEFNIMNYEFNIMNYGFFPLPLPSKHKRVSIH